MDKMLTEYLMVSIGKGILIKRKDEDLSFAMGILKSVSMGKSKTGEIVPESVTILSGIGIDNDKEKEYGVNCPIGENVIIRIFDTPYGEPADRSLMMNALNV